ncbi:hypothetical protein EW146_g10467 [Bondarzewia mesenterica]|uniref:Peptidase S53 activation domain-containing protein n=1 Tax=Bondarzewia mesenterica TaxID=1095465 RepID=A0A4V3XBV1_9AGAM|nr:hypothetical protein EW146_g10467 [Bondarzewia mesenterica]
MRFWFAFLALSCTAAFALPSATRNHGIHERRAAEPNEDWTLSHRLESDRILPLRIGLAQRNLHKLEDLLISIAHPDSPSYGQHWSPKEVVDYFSPSAETIAAVKDWLIGSGFNDERLRLSPGRGWVEVDASVAEVEELLKTEYHVYTHTSGLEQIGCHFYSVPNHVREHVDLIKPTVHFNNRAPIREPVNQKRSHSRLGMPLSSTGPKTNGVKVTITPALENCDETITPDCLRALYSVNYTPVATAKNTYGIVEFTPQAFLAGDLDLFFANFSPSQVGVRPALISIDGGTVQTQEQSFDFNGESDLDLQYAMSLTNPQPITLLQTGATFNNWLDAVDASFCTFEGGDDPNEDGIYADPARAGLKVNKRRRLTILEAGANFSVLCLR